MARRATVVEGERETAEHVLLLDSGDTLFSDRYYASQTEGKVVIEAMNLMGYDAMTLGEGDLQLGADVLRQRMADAAFPFLSANLEWEGALFAQPYLIKEVGGHGVAVIGLTGAVTGDVHGFQARNAVEAARATVEDLRHKADIIILLTHVGKDTEELLMQEITGIDVIVGGSALPRAPQAFWSEADGVLTLPSEVPSPGHTGRLLGLARLQFDGVGHLTSHESQMISLGPDFADDPEQLALLQRYMQK